ncbi:class C sortase [[Clostridium] scindens]|uniref:class C sortase n=1 Tax=Clostridium scindens (strain JCM 10418 / VPI 12708) TaxID=29347 RepID=UPI001D096485|nr:class C sortase [[Clostridium] scindens]MCB6422900.1 class C sortase [[Clostridium] scindens]MCG4930953.1 class C sortase [[Clostridium] scindens]
MKTNKKIKEKLLISLGIFLFILGVFFLGYFNLKNQVQKQKGERLEQKIVENIYKAKTIGNKDIEPKKEYKYEKEAYSIKNDDAIGVVRIDKINLVLPIYDNASKQSLLDGVGLLETTDFPSSNKNMVTVLAGHRGSRSGLEYFLNIGKLKKGDDIKISTRKEILYYKVTGEEVIEPDDWSRFIREKEKTKLYLMSCHPYPQNYQRLLIKAELIKDTEINANEEVQ